MKILGKILLTLLTIAVFFIGYLLLLFYLMFDLTYQILFFTFLVVLLFITLLIIIWKKKKPKSIIFICLVSLIAIIGFSSYYRFLSHKIEPLIYFHYKYNVPFKDIDLIDSSPSEFNLFSSSRRETLVKYNDYEIRIVCQDSWPYWGDDYKYQTQIKPKLNSYQEELNEHILNVLEKNFEEIKVNLLSSEDYQEEYMKQKKYYFDYKYQIFIYDFEMSSNKFYDLVSKLKETKKYNEKLDDNTSIEISLDYDIYVVNNKTIYDSIKKFLQKDSLSYFSKYAHIYQGNINSSKTYEAIKNIEFNSIDNDKVVHIIYCWDLDYVHIYEGYE